MLKQKLLFLMPSLAGGGAERTLINLLQKLDYKKYEVDLVVVSKHGPYLNQLPQQVNAIFLFTNNFWVRVLAFLQKKYGFVYFLKKRTQKKIRGNYDLGICYLDGNFTDLLFFIPGLKRRLTWVHSSYKSYRNFARFYDNVNYREKLKKQRYGKLDGIYFVSHDAMQEFKEVFGTYPEMQVVYNLIDNQAVKEKSGQQIDWQKQTFTFMALGSLLPVKGFDRLIRASAIVRDNGFEFKVMIAGSGPEEQKLKELVKQHQLESVIEFTGFLSNPYPLLKHSDVFIMSSVSEALPTVLCEAMILGKPTLVTNCSGCRELVDNGNFGLMAEQDDKSLSECMINYLVSGEIVNHYAKQSIERAKLFDDSKVMQKYNELFQNE